MIRKAVGGILIIIGLIFIIPEGLDFLNIALGDYLSESLGITLFEGVLLTYTVVPAVLIVAGAVLMPGSTGGILTGLWGKITAALRVLVASPGGLIVLACLIVATHVIYAYVLKPYIEGLI